MKLALKPISEQTIVITGATSGIGLATARAAVARGARVALLGRNGVALQELAAQLGGSARAVAVQGDVADVEALERLARVTIERFGGFDTWVNNAGVSIYGRLLDVEPGDHRRLFDTNFWGVVDGSRVAATYLRRSGGAIINIGSTLSDRAIPLQGMYCASKHAVKGFTDALRMELEEEGAPVSVTLVKPAAIATPYPQHAKNYLAKEPANPPPHYAPEVVARTILHCAEHPVRDVFAGGGGKVFSVLGHYAPRLTDKLMQHTLFAMQQAERPAAPREHDGLREASSELRERDESTGHVAESSVYTVASLHPVLLAACIAGVGLALTSWGGRLRLSGPA
ncbi:MAG TPA: SDR family oxidoreductase [Candidatus Binatia bacterium]|jgi:short-subunit dehydrogenase|nr:SDR family oxidoreductase [Candidatus Binatia bacterium]